MDYKANSHKVKAEAAAEVKTERKKVEPVVKGRVKEVSGWRKFLKAGWTAVKEDVIKDVFIPAIQKAVVDTIVDAIETMIYGEVRRSRSSSRSGRSNSISYSKYYDDRRDRDRDRRSSRDRDRDRDYDDIIVNTKAEADTVLGLLDDMLDTYDSVSVADLYDLVGVSTRHTDFNYGWINLRNAEAIRQRDGSYLISMPKAIPLK